MSGIDLLSELRRRGIDSPVVFLTGHSLTSNETLAFERGAIDFIDKTRGGEVVVRRLRLVVASTRPAASDLQPDERVVCGKLVLRPAIGRAYWNDVDLGLTIGEYNIVYLLASNVGRYLSYRAIYDRMHYEGFIAGSGDDGYRTNVRSTIKRIRNKFRESDPTFEEIKNSVALGYCWGDGGAARTGYCLVQSVSQAGAQRRVDRARAADRLAVLAACASIASSLDQACLLI
jgi:two-component system response regulator ChvI